VQLSSRAHPAQHAFLVWRSGHSEFAQQDQVKANKGVNQAAE
jgi:hypothetical protein